MGRTIAFWITTGIIALETGVGAVWDIMRIPFVLRIMEQLGYPAYVLSIMGVWKLLGVIVLLIPGFARPKEWVYAGLVFVYTGAVASHLAIGDALSVVGPLIFTTLTVASWSLRPASRRVFALGSVKNEG